MSGDCHVKCSKPPVNSMQIGSGGNERYEKAERMAIENNAVVRCVWPGSGYFPMSFDGNTVFGCCNYQEKTPKPPF